MRKRGWIKTRLLKELKFSPGTSAELGAIVFPDMPGRLGMRRASAYLCHLRSEGLLKVVGQVPRNGYRPGKLMAKLWALK